MFGLFKNIFGKKEPVSTPSAPTAAPAAPAAASSAPAAAPAKPAAPAAAPAGQEVLEVTLKGIVAGLPKDLQPMVTTPPAAQTVKVTVQGLSAQLGKGAVKISFGELRKLAPGTFQENNAHDQTMVNLPLKEILAKVKPAQLTRRTDQKTIEVPDEIKPVFGEGKEAGGRPAHAAPEVPPAPVAPAAAPAPPPPAPVAPPPPAPAPAPVAPPPPPPAPAAPIKSMAGLPDPASLSPKASAAPAPAPKPAAPAPAPAPAPAAAPAAAAPAEDGMIAISMDAVVSGWPEALRNDLASKKGVTLQVPVDLVEPLMKKGKITFPWKQVRGWTRPSVGNAGAAHDETQVEIPLKLVIPLFMAARKPGAAPQKKVAVGENIPDVFAKGGPAAAGAPAPAAAAPAPAAAAPALSPADIARQAAALSGVAGAVIAMKDGLSVANAMPGVNADALCGFLPDILNRSANYSKELNLGEVTSVSVQTGKQTLKVFKAGNLLLAVLSRPGEALPDDKLTSIATQLAQQSK